MGKDFRQTQCPEHAKLTIQNVLRQHKVVDQKTKNKKQKMKKQEQVNQKVDETLKVLDEIDRVMKNPYLMTRIEQRLSQEKRRKGNHYFMGLRAVIGATALMIILNGLVLWQSVDVINEINSENEIENEEVDYLEYFF